MEAGAVARSAGLDGLRGLAIALMVLDHVCCVLDPTNVLRIAGRGAFPLFFLVAGNLARPGRAPRLFLVFVWGLVLPLLASWVDRPNVLVLYALLTPVLLELEKRGTVALVLPVVIALTGAANGWVRPVRGFDPVCTLALLSLGRLLPLRELVDRVSWPPALRFLGARPLVFYVAHVVVLAALGGWR